MGRRVVLMGARSWEGPWAVGNMGMKEYKGGVLGSKKKGTPRMGSVHMG